MVLPAFRFLYVGDERAILDTNSAITAIPTQIVLL